MLKKLTLLSLLVFMAAQFSGCAAGWFLGGAATGAAVTHQSQK